MDDQKNNYNPNPKTPLLNPTSNSTSTPNSSVPLRQLKNTNNSNVLLTEGKKTSLVSKLKNDPYKNLPPISDVSCQKLIQLKITVKAWRELEAKITQVRDHTELARKKIFNSKCLLIASIVSLGLPAIPLSRWATGHVASSDVLGRTLDASILPTILIVGSLLYIFMCPRVGCNTKKIIQEGQDNYIEPLIREMVDELEFNGEIALKIEDDLDYSKCPCG